MLILLSPIIIVFNILVVFLMFLDPRTRKFDKQEANAILSEELEKIRNLGYQELRKTFIEQKDIKNLEITGASGVDYQVEIQGWWDDKVDKDIRVLGSIDNGGLSAYVPLGDSFIMQPDGSLIDN